MKKDKSISQHEKSSKNTLDHILQKCEIVTFLILNVAYIYIDAKSIFLKENKNSILAKITKMDHFQPKKLKYKSSFSTKTKKFTIQNQTITLPKSFYLFVNKHPTYRSLSVSFLFLPSDWLFSLCVYSHSCVYDNG